MHLASCNKKTYHVKKMPVAAGSLLTIHSCILFQQLMLQLANMTIHEQKMVKPSFHLSLTLCIIINIFCLPTTQSGLSHAPMHTHNHTLMIEIADLLIRCNKALPIQNQPHYFYAQSYTDRTAIWSNQGFGILSKATSTCSQDLGIKPLTF